MAGLEPENPDTDINQDFIESDYITDVRLDEFEWLEIEDITQLIPGQLQTKLVALTQFQHPLSKETLKFSHHF